MLTSKIMEDEFSLGYRGRLRVLNQYTSVKKFMVDLRKSMHPPGMSLVECPEAATLALAADISLEQFVQKHSLLPFHRVVSPEDADENHGGTFRMGLIRQYGLRVWHQSKTMFCPDCIKDDLATRPFSYWRRFHQLPGVYWCEKHRCQLATNPIGKKAFDDMPYPDMASFYEFSEQDFLNVLANPFIQRYMDIARALLNSERPISLNCARLRITVQVKKHLLRVNRWGQRPTLTDKVLDSVPIVWLRFLYPEIIKRSTGEYFNSIDNIVSGSVSDQGYVLALAVLFDSSDEALNYWKGDSIS